MASLVGIYKPTIKQPLYAFYLKNMKSDFMKVKFIVIQYFSHKVGLLISGQ